MKNDINPFLAIVLILKIVTTPKKEKSWKEKYGFEGSISNADLDLF